MCHSEVNHEGAGSSGLIGVKRAIDGVLDQYLELSNTDSRDQMETVGTVLDDWVTVRTRVAEQNRLDGIGFNPMSQLKINETAHSRIIGNLLNPRGSHSQGDLFLRVFLRWLDIPQPESGFWHVTVEISRVDILIWRNHPEKSAVIIENKSNNAGDQPNQIYRYWHQEMFLWNAEFWKSENEADILNRNKFFHVVYLPTDDGKSPAVHSMDRPAGLENTNPFPRVPLECRILSLVDLMALWQKEAVPHIPLTNHPLRVFLSQYQQLWSK